MENNVATEEKGLKLELEKHPAFNEIGGVTATTTTELGKIINDVFSQVFADYYGCNLECQFQPGFGWVIVPKLYFHILSDDAYKNDGVFAFLPVSATKSAGSDVLGRVFRVSQISTTSGVKVNMTDDGKSVLEDFIMSKGNPLLANQKFEWEKAYGTIVTENETFIQVFKLDINKIIKTIFGETSVNGDKLMYQIVPVQANAGANPQYKSDEWNIQILQLNVDRLYKAAKLTWPGVQLNVAAGPVINTEKTV